MPSQLRYARGAVSLQVGSVEFTFTGRRFSARVGVLVTSAIRQEALEGLAEQRDERAYARRTGLLCMGRDAVNRKTPIRTACVSVLGALALVMAVHPVGAASQADASKAGSGATPQQYPAPTNLQALPKTMTGQQVHDLMEEWSRDLGAQCDACHTVDVHHVGPDGHPALNFVDDSKETKRVARMMVTMTDQMNTDYVAKVHGSGVPVTCGMCHRGEIGAEPYAPKKTVDLPESVIRQVECAEQELQKSAR